MPIKRINEFPEGSGNLSDDDIFLFMDDPFGSGITKKISLSELKSIINEEGDVNISSCLLHEYANPDGFSTPTSVPIDGMSYNKGQVISDSAFGPNSSRVALYSNSMFAMVAVDADIETVYYNGETGSDGDGDKNVSSGVSNYRGYYSYHNLISGDDPAIQQIVISKSSTMSGSNRSADTNNDDFTVTGLSGSDVVIVLNLYWAEEAGPDYSSSTTVAIEKFIDLVMFDETTPRTNINNIRTAFYDNSATIRTAIENEEGDLLFDEFEFYHSFQKVTPSGGSGSGAILEIEVNDDYNNEYDNQDVLVPGTGYEVGNTLTVSGNLLGGTSPTNDVTITVNSINGDGGIVGYSVNGTSVSTLWPDSYIIDGNNDQYDIGNFIGTNRTRSIAMVTLAYDPIEEDGNSDNDVFPILTIISADKTISEGQWVWFEDQNEGAFINHTLSTIGTTVTTDRLVNGEYEVVLGSDGMTSFPIIGGTKTLLGAVDEDFEIKTTRTDSDNDADIGIYAADDLWLEALGDDVVISAANEVRIESNTDTTAYVWRFGADGDIHSETDTSISIQTPIADNIDVNAVDELVPPGGVWRLFINDVAYPTLGTTVNIGDAVATEWGTSIIATIVDIQQDAGQWQIYVDQDITAGFSAGPKTATFSSAIKTWTFGSNGDLSVPGNIYLTNGTSVATGTFDNGTGGQNGISLNCAVGYELNWQGGHLRSTQDGGISSANILCDSAIELPGTGIDNMEINSSGLTFPDASTLHTANRYFGSFYDTSTQNNISNTGVNILSYNTTYISSGVSIQSGNMITFNYPGYYNLQFSAQLEKTDSGEDTLELWLSRTGVYEPWSNTSLSVLGNNGKAVAAWNFVLQANSGDYYQLYWYSPDSNMKILASSGLTNPTRPDIPSVILTVNQIN